jgi:hypothetical protein
VPALLEADWPAPASVRAFSTLRSGPGASTGPYAAFNLGLRNGDDAGAAGANRAALHALLGTPEPPRWLRQVHGTTVLRARAGQGGEEPEADAAVTAEAGLPLAILTADCLPVLFCADDGSEIGAAHAGWRGLAAGVLEATVAAMRTPPERLLAWIGPCAGAGAYEVGADVHGCYTGADPRTAAAFAATRPGHWRVDLPWLARHRLAGAGLHRVHGGDECTISQPARWYSHRRDGLAGRMATVILRVAPGNARGG